MISPEKRGKKSQNMKVIIDALKTGRSDRLVIKVSRVIFTSEQDENKSKGSKERSSQT